jgi:hypothetical protein
MPQFTPEQSDPLEDPEQIQTIDDGLLLNLFQSRAENLNYNRRLIFQSVSNSGIPPNEEWLKEIERLIKVFRIPRDEAILAIYKRELERRLAIGRKLAAAVKAARDKAGGVVEAPVATSKEGTP